MFTIVCMFMLWWSMTGYISSLQKTLDSIDKKLTPNNPPMGWGMDPLSYKKS